MGNACWCTGGSRLEPSADAQGRTLRQQDLQEEAQQVAQEVLALQRIIFMEEAPDMAITHIVLGNILHDKGQLDEALEMYKKALDLNMKTVGEDHPETAAALISIGTLCGDMDDSVAAEDNLKRPRDPVADFG